MKDTTIYSIGHGNKKIENFIAELKSFEIKFLQVGMKKQGL